MKKKENLPVVTEEFKHRKKKESSKSNAKKKTGHKHIYTPCLFVKDNHPYASEYCTICGKVGETKFFQAEKIAGGYYRILESEEIYQRYHNLAQIYVENMFPKYVPVED